MSRHEPQDREGGDNVYRVPAIAQPGAEYSVPGHHAPGNEAHQHRRTPQIAEYLEVTHGAAPVPHQVSHGVPNTRNQEGDAEEGVQQYGNLHGLAEGQQPDSQSAERAKCEKTGGNDSQRRAPLPRLLGHTKKIGTRTLGRVMLEHGTPPLTM